MKEYRITCGLLLTGGVVGLVGCGDAPQAPGPVATPATEEEHGHAHAGHGAGPHDGTLADWGGGKFHVEFTVDHGKQEATVYVLGDDEKTPRPIGAETIQLSIKDPLMNVAMTAVPQEGDAPGTASRYVGNHEGLGVVQEYAGTISGVVEGTPYSGDFQEVAHGDHDH